MSLSSRSVPVMALALVFQTGCVSLITDAIAKDGDEFLVDVTYSHADGETETLVYDRVIPATGFRFDDAILAPGRTRYSVTEALRLCLAIRVGRGRLSVSLFFGP